MTELQVSLEKRSYPICIGTNLLTENSDRLASWAGNEIMLVSNETVAPLYLASVKRAFEGKKVSEVILPDGEEHKTLAVLQLIFDTLLQETHSRHTTLVAVGGGVVGDMTGFAAACYQRGVKFIQIPTTLLAQVDSSVGGKTAVNHPLGKNMIGAFHQPQGVLIDISTLKTLPAKEFSAGMAEVIKYGLIRDIEFYEWIIENKELIKSGDETVLIQAIARSCENKADIVSEDEKETGVRAILNLGHTFGHAIEAEMGYGNWLHGEAVAAGMVMALALSAKLGHIAQSEVERLKALLQFFDLPVRPPESMSVETFFQRMAVDKKVIDGLLRLVILEKVGHAIVVDGVEAKMIASVIEAG